VPQSSQTPKVAPLSRRDELMAMLRHGGAMTDEIASLVIRNYRAEVLDEKQSALDPWVPIFRLVGWLDRQNGRSQHEISMRLLKLVEESGEVAQAYIGSVGQNPRKGVTHTRADVADELCDVIITAMVAIVSVADGNPDDILAAKLAKVAERAAESEDGAS
jgi:NTP pyrophosphatase (non-canonical NTP hydrolase)